MLSNLPVEVLKHILQFLARYCVSQLALTCRHFYRITLPFLYQHLELGHQAHVWQLKRGVESSNLLKETIFKYTNQLTLTSKRNGNQWRVQDLLGILGSECKVHTLTFYGFNEISLRTIEHIVSIVPQIQHVQFKYCSMTSRQRYKRAHYLESNIATSVTSLAKPIRVSYLWTEFSMDSFPVCFSSVTQVEFGPNRNQGDFANEHLILSLNKYYPNITHLTVAMPQVSAKSLSETIAQFGKQLQLLSIQCNHVETLMAVATYATHLKSLHIHTALLSEETSLHEAILQVNRKCQQLQQFTINSCNSQSHIPRLIG